MQTMPPQQLEARLQPPTHPVHMVLDTDTFNEVDDQFALAYALLSPERVTVDAIYAAPFHNARSTGPADGMEKSYAEILRLLELMGRSTAGRVFRGSTRYLPDATTPVESEAARDLVARAMAATEPLYVVAIGAITNVASALLMAPAIAEKIVVVWLGGHAPWCHDTREFNLQQDLHAARVVFDAGVPLVILPCGGVVTHLATTIPELEHHLRGKNALCDYLVTIVAEYNTAHSPVWSKVIWDVAAVAWLVNPAWIQSERIPSPLLNDDITWGPVDAQRHPVRSATGVNRDAIFQDLFGKLAALA